MQYLVTGAGQIGTQLAGDLVGGGHQVSVLRRSAVPLPGTTLIRGDAGDRELLRDAMTGAEAVFHCTHTRYSAKAWERDLPQRERAVMDVAAEYGVPVVFPESVYAFGTGARRLAEDSPPDPVAPLGRVRAALLRNRAAHPAQTLSVVAADLLGPTAAPGTSVFLAMVLTPVARGRRAWVLGDPDAPRSATYLPDLTRAMATAADRADEFAPDGDAVLLAPSLPPLAQREMARRAAEALHGADGVRPVPPVSRIPAAVFSAAGLVSPMARELHNQQYLWRAPAVMGEGRLVRDFDLRPSSWDDVLAEWAAGVNGTSGTPLPAQ